MADKSAPKAPKAKAYIEKLDKNGEVQRVEIDLQTSEEIDLENGGNPSRKPDETQSLTEAGSSKGPRGGFSKEEDDLYKYWAKFSSAMIFKQRVQNSQKNEAPLPPTPIYFIELHAEKDRNVFEYEVHFVPEVTSRSYRSKLVDQALGHLNTTRVYNGDARLYLPSQYITDKQEFEGVIPNANEKLKTVITFKRKWKMQDQECIPLYNVLFKYIEKILQSDYNVPPRSLMLPGEVLAVRELQNGVMLICMDTWYFRSKKKTSIYEMLQNYKAAYPEKFKELAMRDITGSIVWSELHNKTFYTIEGFAWDKTPRDTFVDDGNVSTTFIDYYKRHNIDIQHTGQPLLTSKVTTTVNGVKQEKLVCLVPELSYIGRLPKPITLPNGNTMVVESDGLSVPIKVNTVYDLLQEHQAATSNYKDIAMKNIIGHVVLTNYNNKTHLIEDIDWYTTPKESFIDRGNVLTPYMDYYKRQYNIDVQDVGQPLLITKLPTMKIDGVEQKKLLYLVPELCYISGFSSRAREYYMAQKEVMRRDKIGMPLYTYFNKVKSSEKAQKLLAGWGLRLADATRMVSAQEEFPEEQ